MPLRETWSCKPQIYETLLRGQGISLFDPVYETDHEVHDALLDVAEKLCCHIGHS